MGRVSHERLSFADRANQYARAVLSGEIIACKWVKAAAQRHLDDLGRDWEFTFDAAKAERACKFVEMMPHIKGSWARKKEKIRLELWQVFVICGIFGWVRKSDGKRRFRTLYLEVARKNAKSTMLAAIALYMLALDGEAGAEVYSAATTRDQARIVFDTAKSMARREEQFCKKFGVEAFAHSIAVQDTDSKFQPLSAEGDTLDGLSIHFAAVDELHAHRNREVWDVLETGTGSRDQSLLAAITTAGTNRAGICYEQRSYLCTILNTTLAEHDGLGYKVEGSRWADETYFGLVFTIDDEDDWTDENVWVKANPNLEVSASLEDMRRKARKAMQMASAAPNFQTKHLNLWVNADHAWMDMRAWDRAAAKIAVEEFRDWEWYFGIDLASKKDIASLAMIARKGRQKKLFTRHWLPEDAIEESDNSQYKGWESAGHIKSTDGNVMDHDALVAEIEELAGLLKPKSVGYDPGYDRTIPQILSNRHLPMVEVPARAMIFSEPMKQFEADVLSGNLEHDGNPVMTWMVSNVVCHTDKKDLIYPNKEHAASKIDGAVAAIIAGHSILSGAKESIWETRGAPN